MNRETTCFTSSILGTPNNEPKASQTSVFRTHELFALQGASVILTPEERAQQRKDREAEKNKRLAQGLARKNRMLKLEADRKQFAPALSDHEMVLRKEQNQIIASATKKIEEQLDDVKDMKKMVRYAQCVTIRDVQLRQKVTTLAFF